MDDDAVARAVDSVLPRRLGEFQKATGLPVVFGGSARSVRNGHQLTIDHLRGTYGDSLRLLSVVDGRGLGGAAMARKAPYRVNDYASASGITHDYDFVVVGKESLTSIMVYPITVHGSIYGLVYGAVRDDQEIGDVALRNAETVVSKISRDAAALLDKPDALARRVRLNMDAPGQALEELAELASSAIDPELRATLARIHQELSGWMGESRPIPAHSSLTPRELDVLRLVALGSTNAEVAAELGIAVDTVKAYMHSVMHKLDARNRARAVIAAQVAGIL